MLSSIAVVVVCYLKITTRSEVIQGVNEKSPWLSYNCRLENVPRKKYLGENMVDFIEIACDAGSCAVQNSNICCL